MGASCLHASSVGLICNLVTGNISPQFHVVYDDFFTTISATEDEIPASWPDLITFSSHRVLSDDAPDFVPKLSDEWLDPNALAMRHRQ